MKKRLLHYIKEVVSASEYRDTQVAKIISSSHPDDVIRNFYIDNIVFFKGFLDKILNHLMTFPDELDKKNDVYTIDEPSGQENPNQFDDEGDEDEEEEYDDDDDDVYDDEEDEEEDEITEESVKNVKYTPYETKMKEQSKKSVNEMGMLTVNTLKKDIMDFKNGNFPDNDLMLYIKRKSPEFADLANKKIYDERFYKYLYCGILQYYNNYNFLRRLIEFRGKNYIWLISHIKDASFSPYYRKNLTGRIGKKIRQRAMIKAIIPNFDNQPFTQSMSELDKYIDNLKDEKEIKKAEDIKNRFRRDPAAFFLDEMSIMDARARLMILFKNIKRRFMQDSRFSKNFTAIGSRKFIFDYETGRPSTLNNEILSDANQLKDLLLKLGYSFNEIEFEVGKVRKGKQLYSLKELIPILKQSITEIKTFSLEKTKEIAQLSQELDALPITTSLDDKIKNVESEQIKALKEILNYDSKTDKKLGELIKEGMATKKEATNAILKKYNRTKLNRLLALVKEREEIENANKEITREDYEKAIELISDIKHIGNQKMKIIFTLSPRAFISQSTRANLTKNIKSCMNVFYGLNRKFLVTSLFDGSFIAFLVKVNKDNHGRDVVDSKIIDPVARCVIKPYRNANGEIYWVPDNVYEEDGGTKYLDLSSKIAEILSMNNMLPKDTYYLNDKANYLDSVSSVHNDIFSDLYYNNEKLKSKMKDQSLSTLLYLKNRFKERFGLTNAFKKIYDLPKGNEIFPEVMFDNRLDMTELPKIKTYKMQIYGTKIKKLNSDIETQSLEINMDSEIKSIDNLKNIKGIKNLRIINGAKIPKEALQNENLLSLIYYSGSVNHDVKAKKANLYFEDINIGNISIECDEFYVSRSSLNKIKKIEARHVQLQSFVADDLYNRQIEKIKKELVPLIKNSKEFIAKIKDFIKTPDSLKQKLANIKENDSIKNYEAYQYITKLNYQDYYFLHTYFMAPLVKNLVNPDDDPISSTTLKVIFDQKSFLDLNKIDVNKLEILKLTNVVSSRDAVIDLRRFKNLKYVEITKDNDAQFLPKIYLPSSIIKMQISNTMNTIQNLTDLTKLQAFRFNTNTNYDNWPDSILKNIVHITYMNDLANLDKYSLEKLALTPYFQFAKNAMVFIRNKPKIIDIIEKNKSPKINKNYISPMMVDDDQFFDLDTTYSDSIVISFKSKEKKDFYRNKIFYFDPKEFASTKVSITNDFFDFYIGNFLTDEDVLMYGDYGATVRILVRLRDDSPKTIDLRKITEKLIKTNTTVEIDIEYKTDRRDFTVISSYPVNQIGEFMGKEIPDEKPTNGFLVFDEVKKNSRIGYSMYVYNVTEEDKTINLNRHIKIKKPYNGDCGIKLDFSYYLKKFYDKYGEMFYKIKSPEEKSKAFDNFIKTHVKPLTINFSEIEKNVQTLTFNLFHSKNYYGDYKIITILMEKYLYMCQGNALNTIIDPDMESRLEK